MITYDPKKCKAPNSIKNLLPPENLKVLSFYPLILSLSRFSFCTNSFSVGAQRGPGSKGTASCVRPPASQNLPLEPLHLLQCAAVLAQRYQTPALAAPQQILAPPRRFVCYSQLPLTYRQFTVLNYSRWSIKERKETSPALKHGGKIAKISFR